MSDNTTTTKTKRTGLFGSDGDNAGQVSIDFDGDVGIGLGGGLVLESDGDIGIQIAPGLSIDL